MQLPSGRHLVDLREGTVAPRQLFLASVFEVGKALLHSTKLGGGGVNIVSGLAYHRSAVWQVNQRFLKFGGLPHHLGQDSHSKQPLASVHMRRNIITSTFKRDLSFAKRRTM